MLYKQRNKSIGEHFQTYAIHVFEEVQNILKARPAGRVLVQLVVPFQQDQPLYPALLALLKTAQQENPQFIGQVIEVEPGTSQEEVEARLEENSYCPDDQWIRYQHGQRYVADWSQLAPASENITVPWKEGGVYLITGGAGGLGLLFAREIGQRVKKATLVLTGRSSLDKEQEDVIRAIEKQGLQVIYRQVDVTDGQAVSGLVRDIQQEYGNILGIIHAAGIIRDNFIVKKTRTQFLEVLAPKVTGLINVDQASQEQPLDFFAIFSSTAASFGNPGQADYATANAFMDAYARHRNVLVAQGQRRGRTLSINWSLWREGGMHVDSETEELLMQKMGIVAMATPTGINAFYQGLASGQDQVVVMEGDVQRLQATFLPQESGKKTSNVDQHLGQNNTIVEKEDERLHEKAIYYFKKLLSPVIKVPAERIREEEPLEAYGIDSIMIMKLTRQLEHTFGSLPKTLFFEYQNIHDVTTYFLDTYREQLKELLGLTTPANATPESAGPAVAKPEIEVVRQSGNEQMNARFVAQSKEDLRESAETADDIAIIGLAGRYPGARNVQQFWQNLRDGKDCVTEVPKERWEHTSAVQSKWGGFLEDVDCFDPLFFNLSPRDAEMMDPQERLFLECVYETLEDAGYTRESLGAYQDAGLGGNVGVFVGVMYQEYQLYGVQEQLRGHPVALGGNASSIANRVSYFCNFHGPSIAIDTMCSSSLVALHLACQSIRLQDCQLAIAGGVNISIHPNKYLALGLSKFTSSRGRCESFGAGGDGYVPGEGVGAVLLKPLARAIADGDHIYGVIKGTAINHGGKTNGYTVPNPTAQAHVIERAFTRAGIDPQMVSYIEAHGTGTALGDPIEIASLTKVFQKYTQEKQYCAIGSVKSNIGHAESAAGIAGITKVLLQMKHGQLVPSLHSTVLNPHIDFAHTPFVVQQTLAEWRRPVGEKSGVVGEYPRVAGISSFGAGGSNAHILIEEYIPEHQKSDHSAHVPQHPALIVLSAKSNEQLYEQVSRLLGFLRDDPVDDRDLAALAYTLQVGREAMEERLALIARSVKECEGKLQAVLEGQEGIEDVFIGQVKPNREMLEVFTADEDLTATLEAWISKGKYRKILQMWCKGLNVDWQKLYGDRKPGRMSLPTYPFARERYWVPTAETPPIASATTVQEQYPKTRVSLHKTTAEVVQQTTSQERLLLLNPVWEPVACPPSNRFLIAGSKTLIIGGDSEQVRALMGVYPQAGTLPLVPDQTIDQLAATLQSYGPIEHLVWIAPVVMNVDAQDEAVSTIQRQGVIHCFRLIKALLRQGYGDKELACTFITTQAQLIHPADSLDPSQASVHGLVGSLAKEYPSWRIRLLDLPAQEPWPLDVLPMVSGDLAGRAWAYRRRQWYCQQLLPLTAATPQEPGYRSAGVYVVIGGAGGIGTVWSEYLIRRYQARIVWIGRRPLNAEIQARQDQLAKLGPRPDYISADATDLQALAQAYQQIKQRYHKIHGVVQAAIVLRDQSLARMDEERFQAVLAAKVYTSVNLAQVFGAEELDFVLFFSSLNAFATMAGQSNYAAGSAFEDAFAQKLRQIWSCKVKVINWGYWGSVGVVANQHYRDQMARIGQGSIEPPEAMEVLEILLTGPVDQIALLKTTQRWHEEEPASQEMIVLPSDPLPNKPYHFAMDAGPGSPKNEEVYQEAIERQDREGMEALLYRLLWAQMQSLNLLKNREIAIQEIEEATEIHSSYRRWLQESIQLLAQKQYMHLQGNTYIVTETGDNARDQQAAWMAWERQKVRWLKDPSLRAQVQLIETMVRALPGILTGKQRATEVMFPHSSMKLVEGIYKKNPIVDYFNGVLADAIVAAIQERLTHEPMPSMRILEIGAGTGGTSETVLKKLQPYQQYIQEYCYSDVSEAFLQHARRVYAPTYPFLTTALFNVELPLVGQGIDVGHFDLVIAANVLHATKNIRKALRNAKAAIKTHGLLLLNEITRASLYTHLTFGLLDEWWAYEDPELRIKGCPGLTAERWEYVLTAEGFQEVAVLTRNVLHADQQVIVAESDGVIRQPRHMPEHVPPIRNQKEGTTPAQRSYAPAETIARKTEQSGLPANKKQKDKLREESIAFFKKMIGEALKLPASKIDTSEAFQAYGIDSILVVQLTDTLRRVDPSLSSTLFFEYPTIAGLVDHLLRTQPETLRRLVEPDETARSIDVAQAEDTPSTIQQLPFDIPAGRFLSPPDEQKQAPVGRNEADQEDVIAIVGLAGRYPGAKDVESFWDNVQAGINCIGEVPLDRWDWRAYAQNGEGQPGSISTRWGGFLENIDAFDPLFFGLSPREARRMDPQERLFLETAYASVEDAGYTPATLDERRRVGVFVGVMNGNYASGARYWSIANRVSFVLGWHGPSMAVDTACSSSLTAIHLAVESVRNGSCACAVAGGVNLIVDPVHYQRLTEAKMLTAGDTCRAFGAEADGFVDGEGVGAVVLKPLVKAIADGDHIYGIVKGSMINAGGKTGGYTVPNPIAQAQVISDALQRANVPARTISYLEAHGTGTFLGDPIEIAGLTRAFREETQDVQYCALGSVKSNIGHTESASGIAGLTKVLMQLKHQKLAPTLHAKTLNPHIDFSTTPFVVQQERTEWKRPLIEIDGQVSEIPRRAGISSFGAGGANAHLIIEEYIPARQVLPSPELSPRPALIVLSAKNEERLKEQAQQLLAYLLKHPELEGRLTDLAYTLQIGREEMEERLAFLVHSIESLCEKLQLFIGGESKLENLYRGTVKQGQYLPSGEEEIEAWIHESNYPAILDGWVRGWSIDWGKLYRGIRPSRLSLPTYPFAQERYWLSGQSVYQAAVQPVQEVIAPIHALVKENTSSFLMQRFSSTFSGQEFFLENHMVKGKRVMPAVAYLEMARAAVSAALHDDRDGQGAIWLKDVVWLRPLVVEEHPLRIHISLSLSKQGEIRYEVYSQPEGMEEHQSVVYCRGVALSQSRETGPVLDLAVLQAQCQRQTYDATQCYETFRQLGIVYGPGHQAIETLYVGQHQVLAKLSLPASLAHTSDQFMLHPALMDGALQAMQGLGMDDEGKGKPSLPFALQKLAIFGSCTPSMWAWIRYSDRSPEEKIRMLDIDVCDEHGAVIASMQGVSCRVLPDDAQWVGNGDGPALPVSVAHESQRVAQGAQSQQGQANNLSYEYCLELSEKISAGDITEAQLVEILLR